MGNALFLINKKPLTLVQWRYVSLGLFITPSLPQFRESSDFPPVCSRMILTAFVSFLRILLEEKNLFKANKTPQ